MSGYNKGQDIERLLKEIQLENNRLQKELGDIEPLLKEVKQLFQQIKGTVYKYKTGRNLWLGQLKDSRGRTFQQVASTTPPMLPPVPPAPTPNPLAPLTPEQRTLIRNIVTETRRLQRLREELRDLIVGLAIILTLIGPVIDPSSAFAINLLNDIRRLRREIEDARASIAADFLQLRRSF